MREKTEDDDQMEFLRKWAEDRRIQNEAKANRKQRRKEIRRQWFEKLRRKK